MIAYLEKNACFQCTATIGGGGVGMLGVSDDPTALPLFGGKVYTFPI